MLHHPVYYGSIYESELLTSPLERVINNNSVAVTNKRNDVEQKHELFWSGHSIKRQHVGIATKVSKDIEIKEVVLV